MAAIKTTISDVKKSVPNNILWIVLGSAFVVVAILLGVLLSGGDDTNKPSEPAAPAEELKLMTDPAEIDWLDTPLGDAQTASITISANTMAKIPNIKLSRDIDGMGIRSACLISAIEPGIPCIATLSWTAAQEIQKTSVKIMVDYYPIGAGEKMTKTLEIPVAVSTKKVAPAPAPVATPEPAPAPKLENPVAAAITEIAPPIQIAAAPKPAPAPTTSALTTEKCYEFAFGGYDAYGKQIGWIRPQNGRFLFHPFSDTDCTSPNGEYNAETGFITDLKNPSRKIGSDFDHIGFIMAGSAVPTLSNPAPAKTKIRARQSEVASNAEGASKIINFGNASQSDLIPSSYNGGDAFVSSKNPYDRKFVLRQYKPIPATIVNEIRADSKISPETMLPVQATVDRNVYSDNGRTIIIPAGTLMLGYLTGDLPGPYKAIGRMQMKWYRFVRPDGVEFNFGSDEPFAADSQGRVGVPGYGSTDYIEQFFMPMVTAIVPAAVNLIAPISDKFVNQIDLDNNTVTQSGQVRSSELAKNEIITTWNKVAQKLMVDMMDNTVPPFSVAAGTRITVFSPRDLIVNFCDKVGGACGVDGDGKPINLTASSYAKAKASDAKPKYNDGSWAGQVRSFNMEQYCEKNGTTYTGGLTSSTTAETLIQAGIDYRTAVAYCQSLQYTAINNAKQEAYYNSQIGTLPAMGTTEYNQQVLGLEYNADGTIKNPFAKEVVPAATTTTTSALTCEDGALPDLNGCCTGEVYTDMGDQGFNCCPSSGGDCFPPLL